MALEPVIISDIFPFEKPNPAFPGDSVKTAFEKMNVNFNNLQTAIDDIINVDPTEPQTGEETTYVLQEPSVTTFFYEGLGGWTAINGDLTLNSSTNTATYTATSANSFLVNETINNVMESFTHLLFTVKRIYSVDGTENRKASTKTSTPVRDYNFTTHSVPASYEPYTLIFGSDRIIIFRLSDIPGYLTDTTNGIKVQFETGTDYEYEISNIRLVGPNSAAILLAATSAEIAATDAQVALVAAEQASILAEIRAEAAQAAESAAVIAQTGSQTSQLAAENATALAEAAQLAASISEAGAGDFRDQAEAFAESSMDSATIATTQAGIATTAANSANNSEANASVYASQAATSASNAAGSASTATTQAGIATSAATSASSSASAAGTSASNALSYSNDALAYSQVSQNNSLIATASSEFSKFLEQAPNGTWTFDDGTVMNWTGTGSTVSNVSNKLQVVHSVSDGQTISPNNLNIDGSKYNKIVAKIKLISGSVTDFSQSLIFYTTTSRTSFNNNYYIRPLNYQNLSFSSNNEIYLTFDCSNPNSVSTDWITSTIKQIRFDLANITPLTYQIDYLFILGTDVSYPYRQAQAAATSATNATASETAASSSATAASTSALTATTQAGDASTSASQAATSATNAAGSASTATTQAGVATSAANNAGTSATNAQTYANNAATSATNAASSASTATTQAGIATSAANNATNISNSMFPPDFTIGKEAWTNSSTGDPLTVATTTRNIVTNGTLGQCLEISGVTQNIYSKAVLPSTVGKIYEVEVEGIYVQNTADSNGTIQILLIGLDGNYLNAINSTSVTHTTNMNVSGGAFKIKGRFSDTANSTYSIVAWGAGRQWHRVRVDVNGASESGTPIVNIKTIKVSDITESINATIQSTSASVFATQAATSATNAAGSASTATTQAGVATSAADTSTTQAGLASTSAVNAGISETNAASSAINAAGSAAAAASSQTVAARVSAGTSLNKNPLFANWSGTYPDDHTMWVVSGGTITKNTANSRYGPNCVNMNSTIANNLGLYQSNDFDQILTLKEQYYVLDVEAELVSGAWTGAGIYVIWYNEAAITGTLIKSFSVDGIIEGTTGRIRGVFPIPANSYTNPLTNMRFYSMANWTSFPSSAMSIKEIRWHKQIIRPATTEEIRTFNVADEISAAVTVESSARIAADGVIESKYGVKVDVNGYVSGFGLISTANNSAPTSEFILLVDKFKMVKPGGPGNSSTPKQMFYVGTVNGTSTLAMNGDIIADGTLRGNALAIGASQNMIENSDLLAGTTGYYLSQAGGTEHQPLSIRTDTYGVKPMGSLQIYQNGSTAANNGILYIADGEGATKYFNVEAGVRYQFSAYTYGHRCNSYIAISWRDAAGVPISTVTSVSTAGLNGNPASLLSNYHRHVVFGTSPANAATAILYVVKLGTSSSITSYLWVTKPFFGEALNNQTEPSPWGPAGITYITGGYIKTGTVTSDKINVATLSAITANIGTVTAGKMQSSDAKVIFDLDLKRLLIADNT